MPSPRDKSALMTEILMASLHLMTASVTLGHLEVAEPTLSRVALSGPFLALE